MINKPKNSQDQSLVLNRRDFCVSSLGAAFASMLAPSVIADTPDKPATISLPQRKWELFVIQHSHIDLGFTDRQEVIADYHRQFVRQAVEMALSPNQKRRQKDCQFKYTIEGFWSLEQFLRSATKSEQRQLTQALKSGLIELTAGYFHLTELLDMDVLRWTFQPAQRFARQKAFRWLPA